MKILKGGITWRDEHILFVDTLLATGYSYEAITEAFNSKYMVPFGLKPMTVKALQNKYNQMKLIEVISPLMFLKIAIGLLIKYMSKISKRLGKVDGSDTKYVWKIRDVSNTRGPGDNVRNYLARQNLRKILQEIAKNGKIERAADIGCGYGRLTITLPEFFKEVVGFEREPHFVKIAQTLIPNIKFIQTNTLTKIDAEDDYFDFAMTTVVLQHMVDDQAKAVISEMKRIVGNGYILLCEDTDPTECFGDASNPNACLMKGRLLKTYEEWMHPFKLVKTLDRVIEPTYHRMSAGTFMLFSNNI